MPDKGHAVSAIRLAKKNRRAGELKPSVSRDGRAVGVVRRNGLIWAGRAWSTESSSMRRTGQ